MRKNHLLKKTLFYVLCGVWMTGVVSHANSMNVQVHTKEDIKTYIEKTQPNVTNVTTYVKNPSVTSYTIGELSAETIQSALTRLNQYRYIAGLDADVTSDATYGEYAQAAALINAANGMLSHAPSQPEGMSDETYAICRAGAGSTNLGAGYSSLPSAIDGWIGDTGVSSLGHRRWLLNPSMGKTGFGLVKNNASYYGTYTAVYAFDRTKVSAYNNVAWPAQVMPISYFDVSDVWSLSTGSSEDESKITVTVIRTRDGKKWTFTAADGLTVNNDGYGQSGCVMFHPEGISSFADGDVFDVTITGLMNGDLNYKVEFFNLNKKDTTTESNGNATEDGDNESSDSSGDTTEKETTTSKKNFNVNKFKAAAGKRKLTVSWKKVSGVDGYQLQISTAKNFKKKQSYTISKKVNKKVIKKYKGKKLKAKKKYYVRIRTYIKVKNDRGVTVKRYSKWKTINKKTK